MSNEKNIKSQATWWHKQGDNLKKKIKILKPTRPASCDFTRILFPFRMIVRQWLIYVVIFISTCGQDKLLLSITLISFYQNFFHNILNLIYFFSTSSICSTGTCGQDRAPPQPQTIPGTSLYYPLNMKLMKLTPDIKVTNRK